MAQKKVSLEEAKALGAISKVEDGDKVCYFKAPSRLVSGIALSTMNDNVVDACEKIFMDSVIKEISDPEHWLENDALFIGICGQLQSLIALKKSNWTTL